MEGCIFMYRGGILSGFERLWKIEKENKVKREIGWGIFGRVVGGNSNSSRDD